MATNDWKNITEGISNFIAKEFGSLVPVYIGEGDYSENQFLKIIPVSNELVERVVSAEFRKYNYNFIFYTMSNTTKRLALTNVFRILSRLESLIANKRTFSVGILDAINGSLESYEIDESDAYDFIVTMNFSCGYLSKVS
mgnify:CR=1 FL=1